MAILPGAPASIFDTRLLSRLRIIGAEDGSYEKAKAFIDVATPIVDLVLAGPFRTFTLHNRDHAKKLVHLTGHVASERTLHLLSSLECLVLVYAAFLHDMGMALTAGEREEILSSSDFEDTIRAWPELWNELESKRLAYKDAPDGANSFSLETRIFQLQEAGLCAYLRPRHATKERYRHFIQLLKNSAGRSDLFEFNRVSFEGRLTDICVSHNQDVGVLAEVFGTYQERFPRDLAVGGQRLNVQFCAAILRIVDILDFDRERTPHILFESLGIQDSDLPGGDVSLAEWSKHLAIHTIEVSREEVVVTADSRHPVVERTIRDFGHLIEREIRDTSAVLRRNTAQIANVYCIDLPVTVRMNIHAQGYIFADVSLRLNEVAITNLLMGARLYSHPAVVARELIQNALDACSARLVLSSGSRGSKRP